MTRSIDATARLARRGGGDRAIAPTAVGVALSPIPRPAAHFHLALIVGLGLDPVRVSKFAGHSNVSVTLNVYAEEFDKAMHRDDLIARIEKAGLGAV